MYFLLSIFFIPLITNGIPMPTILDTDIGTAYDDHLALVYILSRPDLFDLKLVVCSTTNTTARAQIVAKIFKFFKRFDIPIGIGRISIDTYGIFEYRWAQDYSLDMFLNDGGTIFFDGELALAHEMNKSSMNHPYNYIQIGPSTSLGGVLEKYPFLSKHIRLFAMAGSLHSGYGNSSTVSKEYNIEYDIQSAQIMFNSNWTYFGLAPLDCTKFMQFNGIIWENFLSYQNRSRTVNMIIESYTIWFNDGGNTMTSIEPFSPCLGMPEMHDILAVYLASRYPAVDPTISNLLSIVVTNDGYTLKNQTVIKHSINTCLTYNTTSPYEATSKIGWKVFQAIIENDLNVNSLGMNVARHSFVCIVTLLSILSHIC